MTSILISITFSLLSIISIANSHFLDHHDEDYTLGSCPNVNGQSNFNVSKMFGLWYAALIHNWKEYRCLVDDLVNNTGRNLTVIMKYITSSGENVQQPLTAIAYEEDPAKLDSYALQDDGVTRLGDIVIFYTDHRHCLAKYTCQNYTGSDGLPHHTAVVVILCREPNPHFRAISNAIAAIFKHGLTRYRLSNIDRRYC